jgi:hypothetical protein
LVVATKWEVTRTTSLVNLFLLPCLNDIPVL